MAMETKGERETKKKGNFHYAGMVPGRMKPRTMTNIPTTINSTMGARQKAAMRSRLRLLDCAAATVPMGGRGLRMGIHSVLLLDMYPPAPPLP